ncbi:hypothetical protein P261_01071 [Lachnospiraceae bacterium TWA4]|nr:hypothetical protein P261_01071 [Lachnospiraceae bacterium TWA4]
MILQVKDLEFSYIKGQTPVFQNVNLELNKGEILAILGPNGAGKSTLLNCLANLLSPDKGDIYLNNQKIQDMNLRDVAKIMGYVPQTHNPTYAYTVREFVVMGRAPYLGMFQKPSKEDYELTDRVINEMDITDFANKPYTNISGGQRQQASIARAIVQEPQIIMFDEPANHLDYGNQLRIIKN